MGRVIDTRIVQGFKILSSSYNDCYNFLDITIPRYEFTKWLEVNSEILSLTTFCSTWSNGIRECVRIWIHDEGYVLKDYSIRENADFLARHNLYEKLGLSISQFSERLTTIRKEMFNDFGSSCGFALDKEAIKYSFYSNRDKALRLFELIKPLYLNYYMGIESTEKGSYDIYISKDKEIEKLVIKGTNKPVKKTKEPIDKKLVLTLEEIAHKFNVDVKNLVVKNER